MPSAVRENSDDHVLESTANSESFPEQRFLSSRDWPKPQMIRLCGEFHGENYRQNTRTIRRRHGRPLTKFAQRYTEAELEIVASCKCREIDTDGFHLIRDCLELCAHVRELGVEPVPRS